MFSGSIVALVTPFSENAIDFAALEKLLELHITSGTDGILLCGSTGEGLLLSSKERLQIVKFTLQVTGGIIPVLVGCSGCSTSGTLELVKESQDVGADGVLVVAPFYVKPPQSGIIEHYRIIHDSSDIPIIIYNNPGRCAVNIEVSTIVELSRLERINGLKDSDSNIDRVTNLRSMVSDEFRLFSGDDSSMMHYLEHGGDGMISVIANIEPVLVKQLALSMKQGAFDKARAINQRLTELNEALLIESNPIPVKYALFHKGLIKNELRMPLLQARSDTADILLKILETFEK
jgi:4-hydroxy-tetrahydrodipicolinate synthase